MHLVKNAATTTPLLWDESFIRQHDVSGPRYTSYPTALQFHEEFGVPDYVDATERSNQRKRPLSLYVHLPFCESLCYYCACNKIVTKDKDKTRRYLDMLIQEMGLVAQRFSAGRPVYQMHWGGGTPTYFDGPELTEIWYQIAKHFHLVDPVQGEFSVEVDPRSIDDDKLSLLKGLGFTRLSLGIQDFDLRVQEAINRVQSVAEITEVVSYARALQYRSINFDLIYGLPHQTVDSFSRTIQAVIALSPDRISLFNYAHMPQRFRSQGQMDESALPLPEEKLRILCDASNQLIAAGYVFIGMDHFAKPDDALAKALEEEKLHRNFQGYSTHKEADLIGLGVSSISQIDNIYCQNSKSIRDYEAAVTQGEIPVVAGVELSQGDEIRRRVIMSLLCHNKVDIHAISSEYSINFEEYFASEMLTLSDYLVSGLLIKTSYGYQVTEKGRIVVRKICMLFDEHLPNVSKAKHRFSRIL